MNGFSPVRMTWFGSAAMAGSLAGNVCRDAMRWRRPTLCRSVRRARRVCILRLPTNPAILRRNFAALQGNRSDADRIVDLEYAERTQDQRRSRRDGPALYGEADQHLKGGAV